MEKLEDLQKRLEKTEIKLDTPEFGKGRDKATVEHEKAFEDWVRSVKMGDKTGNLEKLQTLKDREKAVSIGTAAAGGHAVPEVISRQIDKKLLDISPILPLVKVVNVGTSDYKELVDTRGHAGGWVGETDTRSETATSNLEQVAPTMGIVYAYPRATEESLQDIFFDVQSWLIESSVEEFDKLIGAAIISGNGTNKPTGFLNTTPSAVDDDGASPERPFGTLQYVPSGAAGAFPSTTASPITNPNDALLDCVYKLKAGYRRNARWAMSKSTLYVVRKFKDLDQNYIWQPSVQAGQPSMLNGYPVTEMEDMPAIAANSNSIAFGDFRAAYTYVNRAGTSLTIDDNITTPGYVKFYIRRRVGGILRNDDALKLVRMATS